MVALPRRAQNTHTAGFSHQHYHRKQVFNMFLLQHPSTLDHRQVSRAQRSCDFANLRSGPAEYNHIAEMISGGMFAPDIAYQSVRFAGFVWRFPRWDAWIRRAWAGGL